MKVVVVRPGPHFSVQDVANGWIAALRDLGCDVGDFEFDRVLDFYSMHPGVIEVQDKDDRWHMNVRYACNALCSQLYKFKPDLVIVVSGFFTPPELLQTIRGHGTKVVLLATESPYQDDDQVQLAGYADLTVLNDPTNLSRYQNAVYIPHAYDPNIHYRRDTIEPDWLSEFCFVGTGYPSRINFLEQVDFDGVDVALGGNWQGLAFDSPLRKFVCHDISHCLDNTDAVDLYSATKVSANIYRREATRPGLSEGWAMGPREVELAAIGCFYLTEARGENREVLPMIPTFVGPDDFGEKLRYYLANEPARNAVVVAAQRAISDRTFVNHASSLLARLG